MDHLPLGVLVKLRFPGKSFLHNCCYLNVNVGVFTYIIGGPQDYWDKDPAQWGSLCDWDIFFIKKFPEADKHKAHHSLSGELKVLTSLLSKSDPHYQYASIIMSSLKVISFLFVCCLNFKPFDIINCQYPCGRVSSNFIAEGKPGVCWSGHCDDCCI